MRGVVVACWLALSGASAWADACPGNPGALGTSRVIVATPAEFPRVGTLQYSRTLPLDDHEVVLTFDDGPLPPYTNRILDALAAECVQATYFLVGRQANAYPDLIRQIFSAGHTIGTHSQNHPLHVMGHDRAQREIDDGIASVTAALGDARALAPYFRFPGLLRSKSVEKDLSSRALMVWSVDMDADDWTKISADEIVKRAMRRLAKKGKGILLLHDIHPATALALPKLFIELKKGGYRIVHVVPAGDRPTVLPQPVIAQAPPKPAWPRVASAGNPAETVDAPPPPVITVSTKHHRKVARPATRHRGSVRIVRGWR